MARRPSFETLSILQLMMQRPGADHYGLELARAAEIATGTVYPILRRLERDGWVESEWEDVDPSEAGRPRKRLYRLTSHGAQEARNHLRRTQAILDFRPALEVQRKPRLDWLAPSAATS